MLGFVIGLLVGGLAGVIIMCLCTAAKQENEKYIQIRTSNFVRVGDTILKRFGGILVGLKGEGENADSNGDTADNSRRKSSQDTLCRILPSVKRFRRSA